MADPLSTMTSRLRAKHAYGSAAFRGSCITRSTFRDRKGMRGLELGGVGPNPALRITTRTGLWVVSARRPVAGSIGLPARTHRLPLSCTNMFRGLMRRLLHRPHVSAVLCCISLVFCASCGGNSTANLPTTPTEPAPAVAVQQPSIPNIAGTWGARMEGESHVWLAQFALRQEGASVTGTWWVPVADWRGTIAGTVANTGFSGRMEMNTPCEAAGEVSFSRYTGPRWLTLTVALDGTWCKPERYTFVLDRTCRLTEIPTLACDPYSAQTGDDRKH